MNLAIIVTTIEMYCAQMKMILMMIKCDYEIVVVVVVEIVEIVDCCWVTIVVDGCVHWIWISLLFDWWSEW